MTLGEIILAFLGNFQVTPLAEAVPAIRAWVPRSIDLGRDVGSLGSAMLIDVALIALFGLQHSVMARPGFKRAWTLVAIRFEERDLVRHIGEDYERYRQQVPALVPRPGRRYGG